MNRLAVVTLLASATCGVALVVATMNKDAPPPPVAKTAAESGLRPAITPPRPGMAFRKIAQIDDCMIYSAAFEGRSYIIATAEEGNVNPTSRACAVVETSRERP